MNKLSVNGSALVFVLLGIAAPPDSSVPEIPRIIRPRRRFGTVYGFSVVDPGGNWLRFSNLGDTEEAAEKRTGLLRVVDNAAQLGDSHGDADAALDLLSAGLERFVDAPWHGRTRVARAAR